MHNYMVRVLVQDEVLNSIPDPLPGNLHNLPVMRGDIVPHIGVDMDSAVEFAFFHFFMQVFTLPPRYYVIHFPAEKKNRYVPCDELRAVGYLCFTVRTCNKSDTVKWFFREWGVTHIQPAQKLFQFGICKVGKAAV